MNELSKADKALYLLGFIKKSQDDLMREACYTKQFSNSPMYQLTITASDFLFCYYDSDKKKYCPEYCDIDYIVAIKQKSEELRHEN